MEYTIKSLANLAGISTRTLRYYDEIGILKPARINSSGYRIYGKKEVDLLQQIMFYKELDVGLDQIKDIVTKPEFNANKALMEHHAKLLEKKEQLEKLIENVERTIDSTEGRINMSDKEKFKGFKKKLIEDNEKKYGKEIREKYGEETVKKSNQKLLNMTQAEYEEVTRLEQDVKDTFAEAMKIGDPSSEIAQKAADLHRQWLCYYWNDYSKEAHAGLGKMYVDDERFKAYYDANQHGTAEFIRDAILIYTGQN